MGAFPTLEHVFGVVALGFGIVIVFLWLILSELNDINKTLYGIEDTLKNRRKEVT